jgi:hypothetical protein
MLTNRLSKLTMLVGQIIQPRKGGAARFFRATNHGDNPLDAKPINPVIPTSKGFSYKASGFLDTAVDLKNPNFAVMAEAMGIKGVRIERPQDLRAGLQQALSHDGPALIDVVSARQELIMPPKTTFDQSKDFGLFMIKAVLDGRAVELIDLANVNLRR